MNIFMFVIAGAPSDDNESCKGIKGASIHTWVVAETALEAEKMAYEYIMCYGWVPQSTEHACEVRPGMIPKLGKAEAKLYRTALHHGIVADFQMNPENQGKP